MARPSRSKLRTLLVIVVLTLLAPGGAKALAAPGPSTVALRAVGANEVQNVFIRPPVGAPADQPLQVLIALHGMGGNGADFGTALAPQADAHGWLIVAPTFSYGDWTDPAQITHEDPALVAWLSDYVAHLADRTGYAVQPGVLVFGHSRGAQLALHFTEIHPEQVTAVAAASAGTYTLPFSRDAQTGEALQFPFGVADLAKTDGGQAFDARGFNAVPVWIGVGSADVNDADVPDAWDPFIGGDRLERARSFTRALESLGATVSLHVFPKTDHTLTDAMRTSGCDALAAALG
ncbi:MAG TPA: alpha/beta fold hydrolase [Chloroflexota bacterium]|nr:alpha/beta fold hydrolase [Chloroflexota bacterium]